MRNKLMVLFSLLFCLVWAQSAEAQGRPIYTVLQAGGIFGLQASVGKPVSGYQLQFIVGQNYGDRTFVGVGIANEIYRGGNTMNEGVSRSRRISTLPLTVDFRQFLSQVSPLGQLGLVGGLGYAMPLGGEYYHGLSAKAGLSYAHLLSDRSNLKFTLSYGFQQFDSRISQAGFDQQQIHLTVGLFSY